MTTKVFRGDAVAVAQVQEIVVGGSNGAGQLYTVTINGKDVEYEAAGTETNPELATALHALLDASTVVEFTLIDWTVNGATITATSATAGVPFTATSGATGTGTLVSTVTVDSAGPNHWDTADNWSPSGVPANSDDVYLRSSNVPILWGLDQNGVTLTSLNADSTYTGYVGLPDWNAAGFYEYREKYLKISATTVNFGTTASGQGGGSGRFKLNTGSNATTINVQSTGSPAVQGSPALILAGSHASNVLNVLAGNVGAAIDPGLTSQFATVRIGFITSPLSDVTLAVGSGGTVATVNQSGGRLSMAVGCTTHAITNGEATYEAGSITTLTIDGGTVYYKGTGTIGTVNGANGGGLIFSRDLRGRTITNCTMNAGFKFEDKFKTVAFTNPFVVSRCSIKDLDLDLGESFSLQRS